MTQDDKPLADVPAAEPVHAIGKPEPRFDALIERWFQDHFPNSPVARDTAAWNHAMAAKDDLKRRLQKEN